MENNFIVEQSICVVLQTENKYLYSVSNKQKINGVILQGPTVKDNIQS